MPNPRGRKKRNMKSWVKSGNKSKIVRVIRVIVFWVGVLGWLVLLWHLLKNWLRY